MLYTYIFLTRRSINGFRIFYRADAQQEKSIAVPCKAGSFKPGDKVSASVIIFITLINLFIAFMYIAFMYIALCSAQQHLVSKILALLDFFSYYTKSVYKLQPTQVKFSNFIFHNSSSLFLFIRYQLKNRYGNSRFFFSANEIFPSCKNCQVQAFKIEQL